MTLEHSTREAAALRVLILAARAVAYENRGQDHLRRAVRAYDELVGAPIPNQQQKEQ